MSASGLVLSVASEVAPLIKTGGLADVAGALPGAMAGEGWRLVTLVPGYPAVMAALKRPRVIRREEDLFGGPGEVLAEKVAGLELLVIDAPHLYGREGGPYLDAAGHDWPDNAERFAALSWLGAAIASDGLEGEAVDVLHVHDWQGALAPLYLRLMGGQAGTLITVHNIAFHGWAPASKLDALRLPSSWFTPEGIEYWGGINALKAGLICADRINTVSPTYARELMTPEFGQGLDGVLRARADRDPAAVSGILNGIDEQVWNPATDENIKPYKLLRGKARNRDALLEEFGLSAGEGPLCVVVSRLSGQKGLDLLLRALPALSARDGRLILLGSGDSHLERLWREAAQTRHDVAAFIGYDEALSHRIIAGGDAILIPSRFEPCGLTQLYGLRYGTVPLVADTGGLADTVIDANPAALSAGVATGVKFRPVEAGALGAALTHLCDLYAEPATFATMQRNGMRADMGWSASARAYGRLYAGIANGGG